MRAGLKTRETARFTTVPGMSAVGASSWLCPWNGLSYPLHSAAQNYSLMYNEEKEAFYAEVHANQNAYFDGKSPYTRDRAEFSRDPFSRPHATDLWMAGHLWIRHHKPLGGSGGQQPILYQWHDKGDAGDAGGMPPPVSIIYTGTLLRMQYAYSTQDPYVSGATAGSTNIANVATEQWQTIVMRVKAGPTAANGEVDVWLNGTQYVTYRGLLSTPNVLGLYEKFGIYRFSDTIDFSVCWAKLDTTTDVSLAHRINEAKPTWTPSTWRSR